MAFSGYLIKVGDYIIPKNWIAAESYKVAVHGQDLDSYRDANGVLHRTALENVAPKAEFTTPAMRTNKEFADFMANIRKNYINATEKKASVTLYIPELDKYVTQDMYVPDIEPEMYSAIGDVIRYKAVRIAFIGYGGKV